jgi:hypothetical protein
MQIMSMGIQKDKEELKMYSKCFHLPRVSTSDQVFRNGYLFHFVVVRIGGGGVGLTRSVFHVLILISRH